MNRFDKPPLEGNEARLNHGDSERVRLKEEGMTTRESMKEMTVDELLKFSTGEWDKHDTISKWLVIREWAILELVERIRSLSAELTELRQAKESLEETILPAWYCGCGHTNGCNLAVCAACGRTPNGDHP